jgi:CelD/BcsL family acetyltransferase involved in cellulose biosynthesis
MRLIQLNDVAQLRARAAAWDDLWQASDVAASTARAALVALWLETFAPRAPFRCLAVEQDGSFGAVLPLVQTRVKKVLGAGGVVGNSWCAAGQLLVDPQVCDDAIDLLARGLCTLPWPVLWLEGIDPTTPAWRRFLAACARQGVAHHFRHDCLVGLIDISHDWPAYEASRSKNLTRGLRRTRRRLEDAGRVEFHTHLVCDPDEAEPLLRRAFEIEERSWKAARGTPVSRLPAVMDFFLQKARQLAQWHALDISFLDVDGRAVAFEYGYRGKGVHLGHKTGYDEALAAACPGQHLIREMLRGFHADATVHLFDCLGPMSDAISRWATRTYPEGRLLLTPPRLMGRALWNLYRLRVPLV